jgi:GNAT superfamily N-acetyltransferase
MRVVKGWGAVEEELWPDDGKTWPIIEPPGLDLQAKANRIGVYQRVNTVEEFCRWIYTCGGVQASFEIDDSWYQAPKGVIPPPNNQPISGIHCILLIGYDDRKQRFVFQNTWGARWGGRGLGFLPYSYFTSRFVEGWTITLFKGPSMQINSSQIRIHKWGIKTQLGDITHGVEIIDHGKNEVIAWGFAIERETSLDLEELFVRPNWRRCGYGSEMASVFSQLGIRLGKKLRAWVPHPDSVKENEIPLNKIIHRLGLSLRPSPVRWAAAIGE